MAAAISHLNSGLLLVRARSLFSERPIYLRSSAFREFGTVLEIPTFRRAVYFNKKRFCGSSRTGEASDSSRPSQAFIRSAEVHERRAHRP